jgi:DNA-binding CsgD family transcriptional regulator
MNRSASNVLELRDGLLAKNGRLTAEHPPESARLELLIHQATATSIGIGLDSGGTISISRKSRGPLHVVLIPVRSVNLDMPTAAAVAFVVDPEKKIRAKDWILRGLFRLTPAECRVAVLLGEGRSLPEIAATLGVTRNTLKTQVTNVYAKTGVSRQSQLARLLQQLPPDLPPPART